MTRDRSYQELSDGAAPALSDERLMALVNEGDESALADLIHRYEAPLFNYARKMLGNSADAEDVFQESFLRVYQHRARFRAGAPFRPWLYRIATNLCKDKLRYRKRRPEIPVASLSRLGEEMGHDPLNKKAGKTMQPDEAAIAGELATRMETALASLSVKHRAVFLMAHQEGLTYAEIATALRIPTGTVKSRMNKAVRQLMDVWEASQ